MIESIKGTKLEILEPANLHKIGDLFNFEGPFLSLFTGRDGGLWIYDWCESDKVCHRWLIVSVSDILLEKFFQFEASHYDLIMRSPGETVTIVDMNTNLVPQLIYRVAKNDIPLNYLPDEDAMHEPEFCPHEAQILSFLANRKEAVAA